MIVLVLFVAVVLFGIGYLVGGIQQSKNYLNETWKNGQKLESEITGLYFPPEKTSSLNEVPQEFLMGGDIDRALHIAGVKEASLDKQIEWQSKRKELYEEKSALNDEQLMKYLTEKNDELLIKAGIKKHDQTMGAEDLVKVKAANTLIKKISLADIATPKGYDPIKELQQKTEAARREADRVKKDFVKRNFEALPLSRLSVEGMSKIIELVREDIQNQVKEIEKNTPEIVDEVKPTKKDNPKQMNGVESDKPFVKTRKNGKKKTEHTEPKTIK